MDSSAIGPMVLTAEKKALLSEGIGLYFQAGLPCDLSHCGGRYSKAIYECNASNVFDHFIKSKDPLDYHGLFDILEAAFDELSTDVEDGSLDEVTKKLLKLYDECRDGISTMVEELRITTPQTSARVVKVSNGNNEESDDEDEESYDEDEEDTCMNCDQVTDMMVDTTEDCSNRKAEAMPVDEPAEDDGLTRVGGRKTKGKRN